MRLALMCALGGVLLLVGAPRLFEPATWTMAQAMRQLGPISGWRCAQNTPYTYEPRRGSPDATLLAEAPEQLLEDQVPDLQVDRVEADLHGGDTVVWTRLVAADDTTIERRVYVLSPGRLQSIGIDLDSGWAMICNSHLGGWHIVAEHGME
jgi:hypothetical protein